MKGGVFNKEPLAGAVTVSFCSFVCCSTLCFHPLQVIGVCVWWGGGSHVCLHAALSSAPASPGCCELAKQLLAFMEQESWLPLRFRW